jgi:tRNA(adenine34) deaminase
MTARDDERWMAAAIVQARVAERAGDVPVGAVVVRSGKIIAQADNRAVQLVDPTAHAEMLAIREAAAVVAKRRLQGCTLYVTLEPCAMCAGAIVLARLDRLVFGAYDDKAGMVGSVGDIVRHPKLNHRAEVLGGVLAAECGALLSQFFRERRETSRSDP